MARPYAFGLRPFAPIRSKAERYKNRKLFQILLKTVSMSSSIISEKYVASHDSLPAASVQLAGDGDELIVLGDKRYYRHELLTAFGGLLMPERYAPYPKHQFGNAAALGLASFALTTFVLGLYLAGAQGITKPNVAVGLCFFYGGFVEAFAGIWELVIGNCFAGTVLVSFGMGFWLSFGAIHVEAFGIAAAYGDDIDQFNSSVGFYLIGWGIFCFMMLMCTLKSTVVFMSLFLSLDIAFFVLAGHYFTGSASCLKAGGILCVILACCGWYCAFAGVANRQNSYIIPNAIPLPVRSK